MMLVGSRAAALDVQTGSVGVNDPTSASPLSSPSPGDDLEPRENAKLAVHGYMRVRGEALNNLDLDRGLTPSGKPLFPVPVSDPSAQTLTYADMRMRADVAAYAPGGMLAAKLRVDILDNLPFGGNARGVPFLSTSQTSPGGAFRVKRAYGEAKLPIGYLAVGRMGVAWGMGMIANGGDCIDCDFGDSADRVTFITSVADHYVGVAYDVTSIGPFVPRLSNTNGGGRYIDLEPTASVRTATFTLLRNRDELSRDRRRRAGKGTFDYGAYLAHRSQNEDVPSTWMPSARPVALGANQVIARNYTATVVDGWAQLTLPWLRAQAEVAWIVAEIAQPSLVPGVLFNDAITSNQYGGAFKSDLGPADSRISAGLDAGYASGDTGPGFGAFPRAGAPAPRPGELDGPKADLPRQTHVDNLRFNPDFRIDRILFREIIGTVTGVTYLRPHARWDILASTAGVLGLDVACVGSWALYASSTPGGRSPLGVEIDPTLSFRNPDGFGIAFDYAALVPLAGLDNPAERLAARPAQLARARVTFRF